MLICGLFYRSSFHWCCWKPILCRSRGAPQAVWARSRCVDSWGHIVYIAKWSATILGRLVFFGNCYKSFSLFILPAIYWKDLLFWIPETQQGIFDAVLKGYIDFDSDPWPLISDSAKDLIRKMLCSSPSERLTAHEVLCMSDLSLVSWVIWMIIG